MGIDRRQFMKLAAGFGAGFGAGAMVTPLPWQMLDDIAIWSQNWSWIPSLKGGATTFAPAVSKTCPSSAAVRIRLVGGRPVRVLPNTEHPLGGGVTALAAAELQLLNSPARVAHPLKRNADGSFSRLDWSEAAQLLCEKLAEAGEEAAFISGDENGSVNEVISSFAAALGSKQVFLMPSEGQCAARACDLLGLNAQLGYDLERSDYVLSIGANLLETWGTVVRNRRLFGASHPHPQEGVSSRASLVYAGPLQNNTAAVADSWLPIPPGFEIVLALGLAHLLISRGRTIPAADFGPFAQMTADYDLDSVAQATGLAVETLTNLADKLLAAKAPVVILGGEFNQGAGAAAVMAGFAVNALLGKINAPGGLRLLPKYGPVLAGARSRSALYGQSDLAAWMGGEKKGPRPAALVIHEANPAFALPDPAAAAAFLKETPFKAAFACFLDETAALCDLVLPIPMGLERMDDLCNPYGCGSGIYCATLPVAQPGADARPTADILFFLTRQMGLDLAMASYEDLIRARAVQMRANFDILAGGFPVVDESVVDFRSCSLRPDILSKAAAGCLKKSGALSLAVWSKLNLGTPSTGIPPFNTKTLRSSELDGANMSVLLNSATAKAHGIREGRLIQVGAGGKSIRARAKIFEGVTDNTLAVCLGYGHTAFDGFSQGKGANVMELLRATAEEGTGLTVWHRTNVDVSNS